MLCGRGPPVASIGNVRYIVGAHASKPSVGERRSRVCMHTHNRAGTVSSIRPRRVPQGAVNRMRYTRESAATLRHACLRLRLLYAGPCGHDEYERMPPALLTHV